MAYKKYTAEEIAALAARFEAIAAKLYKMQGQMTLAKMGEYEMQAGKPIFYLGKQEDWVALLEAQFNLDLEKHKARQRGTDAAAEHHEKLATDPEFLDKLPKRRSK